MKTYSGKILISRPMQFCAKEYQPCISIEVENNKGQRVVHISAPEEGAAWTKVNWWCVPPKDPTSKAAVLSTNCHLAWPPTPNISGGAV